MSIERFCCCSTYFQVDSSTKVGRDPSLLLSTTSSETRKTLSVSVMVESLIGLLILVCSNNFFVSLTLHLP